MNRNYKRYKTTEELADAFNARAEELDDKERVQAGEMSRELMQRRFDDLEQRNRGKPAKGTVRHMALELLCAVDYYEDKTQTPTPVNRVPADHPNARSVGYSYSEICDAINRRWPNKPDPTRPESLRWYAVKVRAGEYGYEGYQLAQRRPRDVKKKIREEA